MSRPVPTWHERKTPFGNVKLQRRRCPDALLFQLDRTAALGSAYGRCKTLLKRKSNGGTWVPETWNQTTPLRFLCSFNRASKGCHAAREAQGDGTVQSLAKINWGWYPHNLEHVQCIQDLWHNASLLGQVLSNPTSFFKPMRNSWLQLWVQFKNRAHRKRKQLQDDDTCGDISAGPLDEQCREWLHTLCENMRAAPLFIGQISHMSTHTTGQEKAHENAHSHRTVRKF